MKKDRLRAPRTLVRGGLDDSNQATLSDLFLICVIPSILSKKIFRDFVINSPICLSLMGFEFTERSMHLCGKKKSRLLAMLPQRQEKS